MKKIILSFVLLLVMVSCSQQDKQVVLENARYKMFPTENIWNFLKLDTSNGKIWQVQFSINDGNRMEVELNNKELVSNKEAENGRFTLYPTKNMFNFILLDQISGKTWQAQWSVDEESRGIIPIKE